MNFDEIRQTWQSAPNQPAAAQLQKDKMKFYTELRRRRRGAAIFMIWILAVLTAGSFQLLKFILRPDPAKPAFDWAGEWSVLVLLALPWAALAIFYRAYRRHRAAHAGYDQSIQASLRGLLDENQLAQHRQKWAAILCGVMLLVIPVVVYQLRAVGKAGDEILVPAFVLLPLLLAAIYAGLFIYQHRVLTPRRRKLEALLAGYGDEGKTVAG